MECFDEPPPNKDVMGHAENVLSCQLKTATFDFEAPQGLALDSNDSRNPEQWRKCSYFMTCYEYDFLEVRQAGLNVFP